MVSRLLIAAMLIAAAFDGSAQTPPPPTKKCAANQPECVITVTVPAPCNACKPKVDHDAVAIEKGNKNQITWKIATPNYAFDRTKGIDFTDDPSGSVFKCHAEQNAAIYVCTNAHPITKPYKYTVNVTGAGNPTPLDPWVVNE